MNPLTFRRWRNKGYAVFASLHRVIRIGTLSVAYTLLNLPVILAQGDTLHTHLKIELEEVELSAEAAPEILSPGLIPLTVITSPLSFSAGAQSLDQLLEHLPQTDLRQRGPMGVQADISLRGGTFDQTMILLNGINITDPQTGHFNLNLPFDLSVIDRIEVLKGPGSLFYGSSSFAGAVNIITRPESRDTVRAGIGYGSFNSWQSSFTAHFGKGETRLLSHLSAGGYDGYRANTDFRYKNLYLQGIRTGQKLIVRLSGGINSRDFGANSFYSLRYPEQYEETAVSFITAALENKRSLVPLQLSTGLRISNDHFLLKRTDPSFYQNFHRNYTFSAELNGSAESRAGLTRFGFGYRREGIVSTVLGQPLQEPPPVRQADSLYYSYGDERDDLHLSLNQRLRYEKFTFSAGRYGFLGRTERLKAGLFPGTGISYKAHRNWDLYASMNRSLRRPTFTELYYKGPQNVGNPTLLPEEAWTGETGINGRYPTFETGLSVFYRKGNQIIDWVWMEDEKWHTMNYTRLNTFGSEINATLYPQRFANPLPWLSSISGNWSYTEVSKMPESYSSYYALDYLRNSFSLNLILQPVDRVTVLFSVAYRQRNGSYSAYDAESGSTVEKAYNPYSRSDLEVRIRLHGIEISAGCANLFNTEYLDFGGLPQPGRWFNGGIRIN